MQMNISDHSGVRRRQVSGPKIRVPQPDDGPQIWRLIRDSGALDTNSLYCNLLQCSHFAETCAVAENDCGIVGWLSAYVPPTQPDTLFVWQICVADAARGCGLGSRLITAVLERSGCADLRHVECTITRSNAASWSLFRGVARTLDADLSSTPHFLRNAHLDGRHDTELRVTIGPFAQARLPAAQAA